MNGLVKIHAINNKYLQLCSVVSVPFLSVSAFFISLHEYFITLLFGPTFTFPREQNPQIIFIKLFTMVPCNIVYFFYRARIGKFAVIREVNGQKIVVESWSLYPREKKRDTKHVSTRVRVIVSYLYLDTRERCLLHRLLSRWLTDLRII